MLTGTGIPVPVRLVYPVEGQTHHLIKEGSSLALELVLWIHNATTCRALLLRKTVTAGKM